mmetsp:Transcript_61325/g.159190  ORF Transcript_61325/g.159190 Transcript_61325/m.159190 type:complete len:217 (+) Transcript_61325:997-1647(+)
MFAAMSMESSKVPYFGFAAAVTAHREFSFTCMPAFAMVTHCCSIASWMATRSPAPILSNSSIQITPLSARTMAPASRWKSLEPGSFVIAAVRPTPLEPRPVVAMARGDAFITKRSICDLPHEGSPTRRTLMSPRRCVPFFRFRSVPPIICSSRPSLTVSWPQMAGAKERARSLNASGRAPTDLMFVMSVYTKGASVSSLTAVMLVAMIIAGKMPLV